LTGINRAPHGFARISRTENAFQFIVPVLRGGVGNLAAYLAGHVLLCLLPAFFIAGAMAALIPEVARQAVKSLNLDADFVKVTDMQRSSPMTS
jgi:hypothetical protein